jgi:hypothetical protein
VAGRHGIDREQADTLAGTDYGYVGMIPRNRLAVVRPFDLDRVIALQHRASHGDGVPPISRLVADNERHNFRGNYGSILITALFCDKLKKSDAQVWHLVAFVEREGT